MRLVLDADFCQGHAACVAEAPEVFEVDPETNQVRFLQERPPESLRAQVEAAVKYCPTRALELLGD